MRPFTPSSAAFQEFGFVGILLTLLLWPVRVMLAIFEWLLVEVIARLMALLFETWDAVWRHRREACQRAELQVRARLDRQREETAIRLLRTPFVESLRIIDEFDRRQAQLAPHFLTSLQASRAICEAVMTFIPQLTSDPAIQEHLRAELTRILLDES